MRSIHQAQMANHYAAIESDLGAGHPVGFYFAGDPKLKEILKPVSKVLEVQEQDWLTRRMKPDRT